LQKLFPNISYELILATETLLVILVFLETGSGANNGYHSKRMYILYSVLEELKARNG